jgi:hypothetical protein
MLQRGMFFVPDVDTMRMDAGDNAHAFGSGIE